MNTRVEAPGDGVDNKYSRPVRLLHWVSAAVILWAMLVGAFLATLANESALRQLLSAINVSVTTVFIPVFCARVFFAVRSRRPVPLDVAAWQRRAAFLVHLSMYALTAVVLLSGVLMMDRDIGVFNLIVLPNPLDHAEWNRFFHLVHRYSCAGLFLLLLLHVAAVVRHRRAGRQVMRRISLRGS